VARHIIDLEHFGHAAKGAKAVLQTTDEAFGGLMENRFAVRLARIAQDRAQDPRSPSSTLNIEHRSAGTEIDLDLLARMDLHAPHPLGLLVAPLAHQPFDRLIRAGESDLCSCTLRTLAIKPAVMPTKEHAAEFYRRLKVGNLKPSKGTIFDPTPSLLTDR
jgi:hypothetical protein